MTESDNTTPDKVPHIQPRGKGFKVEPLANNGGGVYSELHRQRLREVHVTHNGGVFIDMNAITIRPVEWLWPTWLARGKLAMLDGDPSLGKSTLALTLAARVSTGTPFPDEHPDVRREPANVILLSAEDGADDTIKPRLIEAGADLTRVELFTSVEDKEERCERPVHMPAHVEQLETRIRETNTSFVVVDVLSAYIGGRGMNSFADADVRTVLMPLTDMASRTNASVLALRHLNKSGGTNAMYRGGGSIAFIGAARHAYVVGVHPEDETKRVLACVKNNLAPMPTPVAYSVVGGDTYDTARIRWHGVVENVTLEQLMGARDGAPQASVLDEAVIWLRNILANGPVPKTEIDALAELDDIREHTLRRAQEQLGIVPKQRERRSWWQLP